MPEDEQENVLQRFLHEVERFGRAIARSERLLEQQEKKQLGLPVFYNKALIDNTSYTLDDRERERIFVWSPTAFSMNILSPVAVVLPIPVATWTLLGFISGTLFTTTGLADLTTITFKCTNSLEV